MNGVITVTFSCSIKKGKKTESWTGIISKLKNYGSHYEMRIESLSSITVLFGKTSLGNFACMPDFGAGCHLGDLDNELWNMDKLIGVLGKVDGITVTNAFNTLAGKIDL
jgi:hypothetical protein